MTALRKRMLEDLQIRHYSKTTIRLYLHAVSVFAQHFGKPPDQLGAEHIRLYQLFLIRDKQVSLSTFIQVVSALRFFYTHTLNQKIAIERIPFPRRERKLPLILSREEIKSLLQAPPQSPPSHDAGRALRFWTAGRRSRPTQSERHRHAS